MIIKKLLPFLALAGITIFLGLIHNLIFYVFNINHDQFHYSLETLYFVFFILSAIIFKVLLTVRERSFDNVGMSFLLATSIKMIFCYLILRPLLEIPKSHNSFERMNFFFLFIIFLTIETLFTIRLVNEKQ